MLRGAYVCDQAMRHRVELGVVIMGSVILWSRIFSSLFGLLKFALEFWRFQACEVATVRCCAGSAITISPPLFYLL